MGGQDPFSMGDFGDELGGNIECGIDHEYGDKFQLNNTGVRSGLGLRYTDRETHIDPACRMMVIPPVKYSWCYPSSPTHPYDWGSLKKKRLLLHRLVPTLLCFSACLEKCSAAGTAWSRDSSQI